MKKSNNESNFLYSDSNIKNVKEKINSNLKKERDKSESAKEFDLNQVNYILKDYELSFKNYIFNEDEIVLNKNFYTRYFPYLVGIRQLSAKHGLSFYQETFSFNLHVLYKTDLLKDLLSLISPDNFLIYESYLTSIESYLENEELKSIYKSYKSKEEDSGKDDWNYQLSVALIGKKDNPIYENLYIVVKSFNKNYLDITFLTPTSNINSNNGLQEFIKKFFDFEQKVEKLKEKTERTEFNINLLSSESNGFYCLPVPTELTNIPIEYRYNDDIIKNYQTIVASLNDKSPGLYLLHGNPGTGKTNIIYDIAAQVNRKFIFISSSNISYLSSPNLISFLLENRNSVIVIEEAQSALLSRKSHPQNGPYVETLLNITDGFLGKALNIAIIATFNTDIKNIDEALIREGRLKNITKFDKLNFNKANKLYNFILSNDTLQESAKELKKEKDNSNEVIEYFTEDKYLSEIFNEKSKLYTYDKKIGF